MVRKWLSRAGIALVTVLVLLVVNAQWVVKKSYADVPEPPIVADRSPAGVARGELLFHSICLECHGGSDGRATGKLLPEVPSFLGTFRSANLAHPVTGVRNRSDGKIARAIRHGVTAEGRLSPVMNGFESIGDADIAAILGYMRSDTPVFAPAGETQPPTELSIAGAVVLTYVAKMGIHAPHSGVAVPPKGPNAEYGRYMARVLDCVTCHTDGYGDDKMHDPQAFAGGFQLTDPTGAKIWTKNITFEEQTGIGRWKVDDFERAVTHGVTPDGYIVRKPMPMFSRLDRVDVEALYAFLATMPKVHHPNTPGGAPLQKAGKNDPPELLFTNLGCVTCHGDGGPHKDKLLAAIPKSDDVVADWILDPQAAKPGTAMPSFKTMIDREQALALARYAKGRAAAQGVAVMGRD